MAADPTRANSESPLPAASDGRGGERAGRLPLENPETVLEILYSHDLQGRFTSVSSSVEQVTGYSREEALKLTIDDLVAPEHRDRVRDIMRRRLANQKVEPVELALLTRQGDRTLVEVSAQVLLSDGKPVGIQGIARRVEDRRSAAEALRQSEVRFRTLVEQSLAGIYIIRGDHFVYVNAAFCEIFGATPEEVYAHPVGHWVADEHRETVLSNLKKRFAGEMESIRYIFKARRADGRTIDVEVFGARSVHDGKPAVMGVLLDVTERLRADQALRESERRFRTLLENVRLASLQLDPQGRVLFANSFFLDLLGYRAEELAGQDFFEMFPPAEEREQRREGFLTRVASGAMRVPPFENEVLSRTGERRRFVWNNTLIKDADGKVTAVASIAQDVTERRKAEAALRESEERYALAAQGARDGLWDWNLRTGALYAAPRFCQMLGLNQGPTSLEGWIDLVHPEDRRRLRSELTAHIGGRTPHLEAEYRARHTDGSYRWILVRGLAVRDGLGVAVRMAGSQTEISERKRAEDKLLHDAIRDPLTGLANRALLFDRLGLALARQRRRRDAHFAVLFIDLDRFKLINESLGHVAGDRLLVEVARRLETCARPGDTVARLGGDEFALLLEELTGDDEATLIAQQIQDRLRAPVPLEGQEVYPVASVGVVMGGPGYSQPEELLRDADNALHRSKELGRARHTVFDPSLHVRAVEQLQLENALRRAIERREFSLVYQPIVSLATGRLVGTEALLRWDSPQRGRVLPGEFVRLAEDTGLIMEIGDWALARACADTRDWQQRYPALRELSVSVNLSSRQFLQQDLEAKIRKTLEVTGLDPQHLHLEITESVILESSVQVAQLLKRLRGMGLAVHLDDFGTGYSSLAYLNQFQVDALKIDRSFVVGLDGTAESARLIRAILHLAKDLGITAIAEGAESAQQVSLLSALGCDQAQGFYFSVPLPASELEEILAGRAPAGASSAVG